MSIIGKYFAICIEIFLTFQWVRPIIIGCLSKKKVEIDLNLIII